MSDVCLSSNSVQTVVTSLVANGALFLIFIALFIILRPKNKLIYDIRVYSHEVKSCDRPQELSSGYFSWILELLRRPDHQILKETGLDGYFFLRYMRFLFYLCCVGIITLLPILLPVNATNGFNCTGFDLLAFGNITNENRYYAHVFLSYIFFGATLFLIYKECLFYTGVRQAVLTSNAERDLLSNRTVLVNDVPDAYLNEDRLKEMFVGVKDVYISRDAKELEEAIEERNKLASILESKANKYVKKSAKKGELIAKPTHRLGKIPFIGKKVLTFEYCEEQIPKLNEKIKLLRSEYTENNKRRSVFLVFEAQADAEVCAACLAHNRPLAMSKRTIGVRPDEIIWDNLTVTWVTRLPKQLASSSFCIALVIFWAIPVAFAGFISQISSLIRLFPWLSFIEKLPNVLYGLISSLLPQVILAVLMMLLPIVIRKAAKISGAPTQTHVEHYTQQVYFAFQVVQVFIITTLSSSIIASLDSILDDPAKIMDILHTNLPRSSNFFMAYMLLQALTIPSGALLQIVSVILYYVLGFLDNTPRKKWNRRNAVGGQQWGTVFPVYSNLAVITLCYSIIAPLILPFAACLFLFVYIAFLNNLTFCSAKTHGKGIYYMTALRHLFVGIYLAEAILLVMFIFSKSWGPLVLECVLLGVSIFVHYHLGRAFVPMQTALPLNLMQRDSQMSLQEVESYGDDKPLMHDKLPPTSLVSRIFKPHLYCTPEYLATNLLRGTYWTESVPSTSETFYDPAMNGESPIVWFPADEYGFASGLCEEFTDAGINASIDNAILSEKGKVVIEDEAPIREIPVTY